MRARKGFSKTMILHFFLLLLFYYFHSPFLIASSPSPPKILTGIDVLLTEDYTSLLRGKKVGLITNQTAVTRQLIPTRKALQTHAKCQGYSLAALFAPEHGINGKIYAGEAISDSLDDDIPIFSLHGSTRRPTSKMLENIDLLIYDIQDLGTRSYTYSTTLFYAMEEAARHGIPLIVLDRPNPINGNMIDGPMLEEKWRSMIGYINVPYCHGMTIGELAQFFNIEYRIGCHLTVIPMKGWKRNMTFAETGLPWIPSSPNIPEATTAFYYPTTGLLGELQMVNIGIGYTLPFKVVGAPWINADKFADKLNKQKFPGVYFLPFYYRPFYGRFAHEDCQGVQIIILDPQSYKPVSTQYLILGILKHLYPDQVKEALDNGKGSKEMFCKANGTEEIYRILSEKHNIVWKLRAIHQKERDAFSMTRKKYLIPSYN